MKVLHLKKTSYCIVMFFILWQGFSQSVNRLEKANSLYIKAKFEQAIKIYENILKTSPNKESVSIYYNLGNAYYKQDNIAKSIYYYEKALQIDPSDEDCLYNLKLANKKKIDVISEIPKNFWYNIKDKVFGNKTQDQWAWNSVIYMLLFCVAFLSYFFIKNSKIKRYSLSIAILFILLCVNSIVFGYISNQQSKHQYAIIKKAAVEITAEPNAQGNVLFELHEGTKIEILERINNWQRIKISDGKVGWISSENTMTL